MTRLTRLELPSIPAFRRPRDLLYWGNERPPALTLFTLSAQHVATALALIAYVLAVAQIGGLDGESTRAMLSQIWIDPPKIALNLATARAIGFDPPVDILLAADEVYQLRAKR